VTTANKNLPLLESWMPSPLGRLYLFASKHSIVGVAFKANRDRVLSHLQQHGYKPGAGTDVEMATVTACRDALEAWFKDPGFKFKTPVKMVGTEFQKSVWRALKRIKPGQRETYATLAIKTGRSSLAARAVGSANARNPLAIFVPCHRVTGAKGKLKGFSGGLAVARKLSIHEGVAP
jgi:methylated-DNA-[protein]-cysteine S-methyltransferase